MSAWHGQAVEDIVGSYLLEGASFIIIDVSQVSFSDVASLSALIRTLRMGCAQMQIAVIASGAVLSVLGAANLEPYVRVCTNLDEAAQSASLEPEYLTSRWMGQMAGDQELPLAA